MAKRKEENFSSPKNAKRPRQEELEDFDKDGDEDECKGTSTLTAAEVGIIESIHLKTSCVIQCLDPLSLVLMSTLLLATMEVEERSTHSSHSWSWWKSSCY